MKKKNKPNVSGASLITAGICVIALVIATFASPRQTSSLDIDDRGLGGGPDSYFRHIYDPMHILGPLGNTDLELDGFQRTTGNAILFAAFPSLPSGDPDFTLRVAEMWSPGKKADDRSVIVFLFMKEKRIRAEIGYGYEDVLSDIATKHLIESTMIPLLRGGRTTEAVEAAAKAMQKALAGKSMTAREKSSLRGEMPGLRAELRRRAILVARIWLHGPPLLRIILGGGMMGSSIWLSLALVSVFRKLMTFVNRAAFEHDMKGAWEALGSMSVILMGLGQAALLVFLLGTMGEYFKSGSGMFGGGGVTLFW